MGARADALRAMPAPDARTAALQEEAARILDRLDALDDAIKDDGLLRLVENERLTEGVGYPVLEVRVTAPLTEARQQAAALRALLADLGVPKVATEPVRRSGLDELRDRRAARTAARQADAASAAPASV